MTLPLAISVLRNLCPWCCSELPIPKPIVSLTSKPVASKCVRCSWDGFAVWRATT